MASILSKYVVLLELQAAQYQKKLDQQQKRLERFEKRNKKSLSAIKASFAALGVGLGAREVARFVGSVVEAGVKMDQFERSLKVATGSMVGAKQEFAFVTKTANDLGLSLESTAGSYSKLAAASKGTALQGQATRDIFVAISEASRVLGLSAEQTGGALTAIEQMISKGRVSAEELRGQLGERLPGAFFRAAKAIGVTTAELDNMLKAGELTADELLPKLAAELHKTFGPEVEAAANDAQASIERFKTSIFQLKVAIAQSGLLSSLASMADKLTTVANAVSGTLFNASVLPFEKEYLDTLDTIARKQRQIAELRLAGIGGPTPEIDALEEEIRLLDVAAKGYQRKQKESLGFVATRVDPAATFGQFDTINAELDAFVQGQKDAFEQFIKSFETAEQKAARLRLELEKYRSELSPAEFERISKAITGPLNDGLETIEITAKAINPLMADMERYNDLIRSNRTPREEFDRAVASTLLLRERLIAAGKEEALVNATVGRELRRLSDEYESKDKAAEKVADTARDVGLTFTSAFEDAVLEGEKLRDVLQGLLKDLARLAIRKSITEPFLDFFSGLFKPPAGRASGGPVAAGTPYVVGEEGPEIFVPRASGNIIPNGGGGAAITQHFHVQAGLPPQWQAQLATVTQIAASAATQSIHKELGGRR